MRLVCVGDSFTEGLADDLRPDGEYRGWADRVAQALAVGQPVEYANLAVRGKLLDQVVREQLPIAADLAPDVLTFHAGGNDVLRRGTDLPDLFKRYDAAVAGIASPDRKVLLFTSITRAGGTGRLAEAIATRFDRFNDNVREVGQRHGATVVELDRVEALTDRRLWHADRLHLNAQGHARVAAAVLAELGVDDGGRPEWWAVPLPAISPKGRAKSLAGDLDWARAHFAPWIWRRLRGVSSGDGRIAKDEALRTVAP
ncbi:MAG: SGNH/GDSL hydrolase family protein [Candidatus Nanopelagicales bacterium]|nr:SGNH/GDSL hydrolase family protein [Candidatus Nanopelagicales bacterium]